MRKTKSRKKVGNSKAPLRPATASRAKKKVVKKVVKKSGESTNFSVLCFGFAILTLALAIIPGKNIWLFFHNVLFGLFSKGVYFLPVVFLYAAYVYDTDKSSACSKKIVRKSLWLFLLIATLAQILFWSDTLSEKSLMDFVVTAFTDGTKKIGGGVVAALIAYPFLSFFGFGGSVALISVLIFVLLMFISKLTLTDLFKVAYAPAKKLENIYFEKQGERAKETKKTNIDIPLDDLPLHPVESNKNNFFNELQRQSVDFNSGLDLSQKKSIRTQDKQNKNSKQSGQVDFVELDYLNNNYLNNNFEKTESQNFSEIEFISDDSNISGISSISEAEKLNFQEVLDQNSQNNLNNKNQDNQDIDNITNVINKKIDSQKELNEKLESTTAGLSKVLTEQKTEDKKNFGLDLDGYTFPSIDLLKDSVVDNSDLDSKELMNTAQKLVVTLKSFGVSTELLDFSKGPSVTRYELKPAAGVKISKITGLADDIALNLAAAGVRIEAPIPNKAAVGIEVPNKKVNIVGIKELINSNEFKNSKSNLSVALGKDISGNITIADIAKKPHILIAGSTGSGKSVCINSIIISLIYKSSPENVRLLLIDPKVVELGVYNDIPHLLIPVVTDPKKAAGALNWAVGEMLKRYKIFAELGVRDLKGYNRLAQQRDDLNPLPQIVIIIDELADLMMVAPNEIEDSICRLAQMARAAGMHLVIATQRPSVDVITGIIKANIPSRIAFAVSSQVDSRTIIDSAGAEKLLGRGDMLFFPMGYSKPVRVQGCFVSDKEVENVVAFVKRSHNSDYDEEISKEIERLSVVEKTKNGGMSTGEDSEEDEMLKDAIKCAVENGDISTSFLQRKLKLGYSRAARLIDEMESRGIVGPKEGSKPRQTLISRQQWIEMSLNQDELENTIN